MDRRLMAWLTALAGTVLAVLVIVFWKTLFGPGTWGSGGNVFAWVLCGGLSFLWLNVLQKERHIQAMTQAREHQEDRKHQAAEHHRELLDLACRHHREMKEHVTALATAPDSEE